MYRECQLVCGVDFIKSALFLLKSNEALVVEHYDVSIFDKKMIRGIKD